MGILIVAEFRRARLAEGDVILCVVEFAGGPPDIHAGLLVIGDLGDGPHQLADHGGGLPVHEGPGLAGIVLLQEVPLGRADVVDHIGPHQDTPVRHRHGDHVHVQGGHLGRALSDGDLHQVVDADVAVLQQL